MHPDVLRLLEGVLAAREVEGTSKVMPLEQAVATFVRPGMTLHVGADASAAICALVRRFHGASPGFTVVMGLMEGHALNLLHAGLVKKAIVSSCANLNPTPGPSPIAQRAASRGRVSLETWSLYSLFQRLQAAALGMPFLPTRAIENTSMAGENAEAFGHTQDPFSGASVPVVKALAPDLSLIHALVADPEGNAIPVFADAESYWGARASTEGAIVTVERVVTTDYIRANASLVKLPSYMVKAVCPAPFGAHPQSLHARWLPSMASYAEDREFVLAHREAARREETMDAWLRAWVLDCPTHEDYLRKLGSERLDRLRDMASPDAWEWAVEEQKDRLFAPEWTPTEMMLVAAARHIARRVMEMGYRVVLSGVGTGGLAPALAYYRLREQGVPVDLMLGTGQFGFLPRNANLDSVHHLATAKMSGDILDVYGCFLRGPHSPSLGVLGAAQVDRRGNVNSTRLSAGLYLMGAGGGNDVTAGAAEALVVAPQSPERFVEQVDFVTMPGERIRAVVSDHGVLEKRDGELVLIAYYPGASPAEAVSRACGSCGWPLKVAENVREEPAPSPQELQVLRILDAHGDFLQG